MARISEWESAGNVHVSLDAAARPRARHYVVADLAAKYGGNGSYLDIGCGMGDIPLLIRKRQPLSKISIADAYDACLRQTARKVQDISAAYLLPEFEFSPHLTVNEKFDVITLSHVLEHLHNPIEGLTSVLRLLKGDGHLVIAVPNPSRPQVLITNIWRKHYVNRGHVFAWDPSHWKNFLEKIMGLNVVEYSSDVVAIFPGIPGKIIEKTMGRALARILPWWGFSNVAVIRAPHTLHGARALGV